MSLIDLHVHSDRSDGSDSPERLVELAAQSALRAFALTDHDTQTGVHLAMAHGHRLGIEVVPGVELSCTTSERTIHVLGYFIHPEEADFAKLLEDQRVLRNSRNVRLAERLINIGINISLEEAHAVAGNESTGRPHFAAVLVRKGYARSIDEAFATYLAEGRPAYVHRNELCVTDAVKAIHAAGGVAVWAHPFRRGEDRYDDIRQDLEEIVDAGIDGIEAWYSRYPPNIRRHLVRLARRNGVVPSGGSDYHGSYKPDLSIGTGAGDLQIQDEVLDELRERRISTSR
jgi:predicted metal-dependent phosphoesterase TrpH